MSLAELGRKRDLDAAAQNQRPHVRRRFLVILQYLFGERFDFFSALAGKARQLLREHLVERDLIHEILRRGTYSKERIDARPLGKRLAYSGSREACQQ